MAENPNWRKGNLWYWNKQLLQYFFESQQPDDVPVTCLVVTAEELARATGDDSAVPSEVLRAFMDTLRHELGRERRSLCADALDTDWRPTLYYEIPPFVSHLIATCVAASDSSEELIDEGSFLNRLNVLCGSHVAAHDPTCLPQLWENLSMWLRNARSHDHPYRELLLPNPGSFRRIGYTVNLAFPHRRDQSRLIDLLSENGLAGVEPPVPVILRLLTTNQQRFSERFRRALEEFRSAYGRGDRGLDRYPLWRAVRDAALWRSRSVTRNKVSPPEFDLLLEILVDRFAPFVVTTSTELNTHGLKAVPSPEPYGRWTFLVQTANDTAGTDELLEVCRGLLDGSLRFPRLSSLASQGVLLFERTEFGLHQLCSQDSIVESDCALVRNEFLVEFNRLFGTGISREARTQDSLFPGWSEIRDFRARALVPSELENSPFRNVWCLQETIIPSRIRVLEGVRIDDGFAGIPAVLPLISAKGAKQIVFEDNAGKITPLAQSLQSRRYLGIPEFALGRDRPVGRQ